MCGIVAAVFNDVTVDQLELIDIIMIESQVRGKHASGVTWHNGRELVRVCPDDNVSVLGIHAKQMAERRVVRMIGHTRYSTSDLSVNQPLIDYKSMDLSIAHNGIVDQEEPSTWEERHGLVCNTSNDSELVLRAMLSGQHPLYKFPEASLAVTWIDDRGKVGAFRNTKRPMWITYWDNGCIITSTRDIMLRASNGEADPFQVKPFVEVLLNNYQSHPLSMYGTTEEDLQ